MNNRLPNASAHTLRAPPRSAGSTSRISSTRAVDPAEPGVFENTGVEVGRRFAFGVEPQALVPALHSHRIVDGARRLGRPPEAAAIPPPVR